MQKISVRLFQSQWETLFNQPVSYFVLLQKNNLPINADRIKIAFLTQIPKIERKVFIAKATPKKKTISFEYFEALAFLELLKQYPCDVRNFYLQSTINELIEIFDKQL